MKTNGIYNKEIELQYTCDSISLPKWESLMKGSVKANGSKIRMMIKNQIPELYKELGLDFNNPYEHQSIRTKTHLIYIHSMIEYFFKIN